MTILLISESQDLFAFTQKIVENEWTLLRCTYSSLNRFASVDCDVVIVEFNYEMVKEGMYVPIVEIKGKFGATIPILAILEDPTTQDIFEVLEIGTFDYLEKKDINDKYKQKIFEAVRWSWYIEKYRKKKENF